MRTVYDDKSGKRLYQFDEKKGILQVAIDPKNLELLLEDIGEIPKEDKDLELPTLWYGEHVTFENVKKVEPIPDIREDEYILYSSP